MCCRARVLFKSLFVLCVEETQRTKSLTRLNSFHAVFAAAAAAAASTAAATAAAAAAAALILIRA